MNEILNPYIAGAPVVESSMFFGREDVFTWIERSLAGKYVDHILVLHGQRRVGKTSVLKQIPNFLPDKYIQVFFDLQGRTNTTLDRFLWWLAREITRTLKQERDISLPRPNRESFAADPEYLINEFLPNLRPLLNDHVLLLTFDEFDTLDRSGVQETLAVPLIAYLRRLMEIEWLNFVFSIGSSGDKLENMQASYTDFFKSALYRKISFLTRDDCYRLITKPVEGTIQYDRVAVNRIVEITSGHPYFTQLMCHELFSKCQKTGARVIQAEDVESVLDDVIERGTVNLKFVWDEASDLEKWILAGLAQTDGGATHQVLGRLLREQRVRFSESDLNSAILHLRDKDVITQDNRFIIHLLRMWLQANRPMDRVREELVDVNPIANRYIEIGDEYREMDQVEQAIESYRQALSVDPDNLKAQSNIGSVHLALGSYQEAAEAFEKALQIDDEDVVCRTGYCDAIMALGDQARLGGEIDGAIRNYQKILVINPAHTDARQQLSDLYQDRAERFLADSQDDEALSAFNRAIGLTPEDDSLTARYHQILVQKKAKVVGEWLAKADQSMARQRWDEAAEMVAEALKLDPENPELQAKLLEVKDAPRQFKIQAYRREAEQAITRGNFDKAISAIKTAVLLSPEDDALANWLESTRNDQRNAQLNLYRDRAARAIAAGDWDAAVAAREAALKHAPQDPTLARELAVAKAERLEAKLNALKSQAESATAAKNWDEVILAWENAVRLAPDDPTWAANLDKTRTAKHQAQLDFAHVQAEEALQQQDWDTAIKAVQDALKLAPEETYWTEKLAEIKATRHKVQLDGCRSEAASARSAENWDAAIAALERYLELEPGDPVVHAEIIEIRTEKRQLQLATLKSQAEGAAVSENWDAAIQAWGSYLELDPEDRAGADTGLQHAQKYARIAKDYTDAQGALRKKHYGRGIELLQGIIAQDPTYKSTSRLLVEAVEANKAIPVWRRPWVYAVLGSIVVVVLGILFGPRLWQAITSISEPTPVEQLPVNAKETAQVSMVNAANAFAEPVLASIADRPPDFEEDFSTPQDYWREYYFFDGDEALLSDLVSDEVLRITDDEPDRWYGFRDFFSGEDFVLQYDFMSDRTARGTTVYYNIRGSQTDRFYIFALRANGYWNIEEDGTEPGVNPIQEGNVKLESDRSYTLKLISVGDQFAIYLDDEPLAYFEDSNLTGHENGLGAFAAWSYNELRVDIDNIKFWNLDSVEIATPSQNAQAFTAPILDYTANTPPAFAEDFSTNQEYWHETNITREDTISDFVLDEELRIVDESPGEIRYTFGNGNELSGVDGMELYYGSDNYLFKANDFVLQFDFIPHEFNTGTRFMIEFRGLRGGRGNPPEYYQFLMTKEGDWEIYAEGLENNPLLVSGETTLEVDQVYQVQLIALGDQVAIFLNNDLLAYFEDSRIKGDRNSIGFSSNGKIDVVVDNIKFWTLDDVEIITQDETPVDVSTLEVVQSYIETQPPTFEDDFSKLNENWWNQGQGIYSRLGEPYDVNNEFQVDGVLSLDLERGDLEITEGAPGWAGDLPSASDFALQFEYAVEESSENTFIDLDFRWRARFSYVGYYLHVEPAQGTWEIVKFGFPPQILGSGQIPDSIGTSQWSKVQFVIVGEQFAVTLNEELVGIFRDDEWTGNLSRIIIATTDESAKIKLDNVKFWNLDGVEIGTDTTPTGTNLSQAVQAYITEQNPIFEDDFSVSNNDWGYINDQTGDFYTNIANNIRDGVLTINTSENNLPNETLTFPTNQLLNALDFALQYNFTKQVGDFIPTDFGVRFRSDSDQNAYYEFYTADRRDSASLARFDSAGARETLGSSYARINSNIPYQVLIIAIGNQIKIFLNDELLISVEDDALSGDNNYFWLGQTMDITIDNVKFWTLDTDDFPTQTFDELWGESGHANTESEAFRHWDEEPTILTVCAKCHSTAGYLDFLGADGSAVGIVDIEPLSIENEGIQCDACHSETADGKDSVVMPSGVKLTGLGDEAYCMECHQGRNSSVGLNTTILETTGMEDIGKVNPDMVYDGLSFVRIHYDAAAATRYGTEAKGGGEYDGKSYAGFFAHVPQFDSCIECHDPHSLEFRVDECTVCHGDGNIKGEIANEIEFFQGKLWGEIKNYAADVVGVPIGFNPQAYPFFFIDTDDDGTISLEEAINTNAYNSWTTRLLWASYNYYYTINDPGAFAHGGKYVIQLLYDSIEDLNPDAVKGLQREYQDTVSTGETKLETIQSYIEAQTPTFEDNFSTKKDGWGSTSEGFGIFSFVEDGYLPIRDHFNDRHTFWPDYKVPGISFPTTGLFDASDFAIQFNFMFGGLKTISLQFRSAVTQDTGYRITFSQDGSWELIQPRDGITISDGKGPFTAGYNKLLLIAKGNNLSVFLNDELIYEADDLTLSGTSNKIIAIGYNDGSEGRFDNFKFWNLDGVDF